MASMQLNPESHGNVQEKIQHYTEAAKENDASSTTDIAHDKASHAADQSAGFLQQTGEQVMSMAQGAIDGVKNTLGVGDNKN